MRPNTAARALAAFVLVAIAVACSSSSTGTASSSSSSSSSGSSPVSAADCSKRCEAKATTCQAPPDQVKQACGQLCGGSPTSEQLTCLEGKACEELASASSLDALCPKSSSSSSSSSGGGSGGTKDLGDSCTCPDASPSAAGYCAGTSNECKSGLGCLYASGSSGKGECVGKRCCDDTKACDTNPSLLKPCDVGTCKSSSLGYYCQK